MNDEPMYVDITITQGDRVQILNVVVDPAEVGASASLNTENEVREIGPSEENGWSQMLSLKPTGRVDVDLSLKKARYRDDVP